MKKTFLILTLTILCTSTAYLWLGKSKKKIDTDVEYAKFYNDFSFVSETLYHRDVSFLATTISNNQVLLRRVMSQIKQTDNTQKTEYRKELEKVMVDGLNERILKYKGMLDGLRQQHEMKGRLKFDPWATGYCPTYWDDVDYID